MADRTITELTALAGASLAATDVLPVVDVSASEAKKITAADLVQYGSALIADGSIPVAKVASITEANLGNTSAAGQFVAGPSAATGALTKRRIVAADLPLATTSAVGGVSASTGLAVSGAGALTVAPATTVAVGGVSVPSSSGLSVSGAGVLSHTASISPGTTSGVTVSATGHVTAITALVGADLPLATTSVVGGVSVGSGLAVTGAGVLNHGSTVTGATVSGITFNGTGHITAATALVAADLPVATSSVKGAVSIPSGALSVNGSGALTHDTSTVTAGTYPKVTVDARGHVTAGAALDAGDIPNISAAKLTTGTISTSILGTNSVTGAKLANYSTVQFGGASSTSGIVTFPPPEFNGQGFFDSTNGDYYIYDGNTWQPLTVISGNLVYAGTYNAGTNRVRSVTTAGTAAGLIAGNALPAGSATLNQYYVVVSDSGNGTSPAPAVALAPPDMIICNGATWDHVDVSNAIAGQTATNISVTPYGNIAATNVQTALQELDDEKLSTVNGVITGELLIGTSGTFGFEGSTANAYETYLSATDPTADRAIVLPDQSGNVLVSGNASIVNADISASAGIAYSKLASLTSGNLLVGNGSNVATSVAMSGDVTITNAGVAAIASGVIVDADISASAAIAYSKLAALASGNILVGNASNVATSVAMSGDVTITNAGVAAIASGVIVNADINASAAIDDTKLATISTASKVNGTALTGTIPGTVLGNSTAYVGTTGIALNRSSGNQSLTGISSVALPGSTSGTVTIQPAAVANTTTITLPATTGTVITTGDTGTVTSTMLLDGTILNADVNASAAIAGTKISPDFGSQTIVTTGVHSAAAGTAAAPSITFTGDLNTGIYSPGADQVAVATNGTERARIDSSGRLLVGTSSSPSAGSGQYSRFVVQGNTTAGSAYLALQRNEVATSITAGEDLGIINFNDSSGNTFAEISAFADASAGSSDYPGRLVFSTTADGAASPTERVRITNGGNVGIGTTSPQALLQIGDSTTGDGVPKIRLHRGAGADYFQIDCSSGYTTLNTVGGGSLLISIGGSEAVRVDGSKRLLVGTSSASTMWLGTSANLQVQSTSTAFAIGIERSTNDVSGGFFVFRKTRSTSSNGVTVVQSGDGLGSITFTGTDGAAPIAAAIIEAQVDGTPGTNDMPGRLVFSTTADGASSPTERMRITNGGNVGINTTTPDATLAVAGTGKFTSTLSDIVGNVRSIPQNAKTAAYTLAATDNGQHISITTGGVTVPSAIFAAGQVVTIFNNSASSQTITQGTSVTLRQAGTASTGNRTLAQYGVATILCVASNTFVITGTGVT
jgi:hypothetical protein